MNIQKLWALSLASLSGLVGILSAVTPFLPQPWAGLAAALLAVAAYYKIQKSHTEDALGEAGYFKKY